MTIGESYKRAINKAFANCVFPNRTKDGILSTLGTKVYGSEDMTIIPPIQDLKVKTVDELHDEVVITFDDYEIKGVFTWRKFVKDNNEKIALKNFS